jgi:hypothetical protein
MAFIAPYSSPPVLSSRTAKLHTGDAIRFTTTRKHVDFSFSKTVTSSYWMKVYVTSDVSTRQIELTIPGYSETKPDHDTSQQRLQLFDKQVVKVDICKFNNTRRLAVGYLRRLNLPSFPYFTSELTQFLLKLL